MYSGTSNRTFIMLYRLYVPDAGSGLTGGVGLPRPVVHTADGRTLTGAAACAALQPDRALVTMPAMTPAQYQMYEAVAPVDVWQRTRLRLFAVNEQIYPNNNNNYVDLQVQRSDAEPVIVLRGTLPTTPATVRGDPVMGGGDMRYWSLCSYQFVTYASVGCLYDQSIVTDASGHYTIAISRAADRPANATAGCGLNWLPLSDLGEGGFGNPDDGMIVLRNMLVAPGFSQGVNTLPLTYSQGSPNAPTPMGPYLPTVAQSTVAQFESLGCDRR